MKNINQLREQISERDAAAMRAIRGYAKRIARERPWKTIGRTQVPLAPLGAASGSSS